MSRRFGARNKLLAEVVGRPMVVRVVEAHLAAGLRPVVVLGYEAEEVREALEGLEVEFVMNENFEYGMGTSIAAGARASRELGAWGVSICPGDLPWLKSETIAALAEVFTGRGGEAIVVPTNEGRPGHPVFFPPAAIGALETLEGDRGAKQVLTSGAFEVANVEVEDAGVCRDLDTEVGGRGPDA